MSVLEQFRKQIAAKRRQFEAQSETQYEDCAAQAAHAKRDFASTESQHHNTFHTSIRSAEDLPAKTQPEQERLQARGQAIIKAAGRPPDTETLQELFQQAERKQQDRTKIFSRRLADTDARLLRRRLPE